MPVVVQAAKGATVMLLPGSGEADLNPADWLSKSDPLAGMRFLAHQVMPFPGMTHWQDIIGKPG